MARLKLLRFSLTALKGLNKQKAISFINLIIFVSFFALTASVVSMYYENKIDQIETPDGVTMLLERSSGPPITVEYIIDWKGEGNAPIIMMSRLAQQLQKKLSSVPGTEKTAIYGEAEEEIVVEVDSAKMSSLGLT